MLLGFGPLTLTLAPAGVCVGHWFCMLFADCYGFKALLPSGAEASGRGTASHPGPHFCLISANVTSAAKLPALALAVAGPFALLAQEPRRAEGIVAALSTSLRALQVDPYGSPILHRLLLHSFVRLRPSSCLSSCRQRLPRMQRILSSFGRARRYTSSPFMPRQEALLLRLRSATR